MQRLRQLTHEIYRLTAAHYETAIGPVMQPLARDLVRRTTLAEDATLLDIGTGTGFVLRAAASQTRRSIGVDLSFQMLHAAQSLHHAGGWPNIQFVQADAHDLSILRADSVDTVFSSFGLGESDPDHSLRSIRRVLRPGGQISLQEWGPYSGETDPRMVVDHTLAEFITDSPDPLRANLRSLLDEPLLWQTQLQDTEDYALALQDAGFQQAEAREYCPITITLAVSAFVNYALSWAPRALELTIMSPTARAAFLRTVTTRLQALADSQGNLAFSPVIFRATAVCPF